MRPAIRQCGDAPLAQPVGVGARRDRVRPSASTARTCSLQRARRRWPAVSSPPSVTSQADLRHDEQHRQIVPVLLAAGRRSARPRAASTRAPSELPIVFPCRADSSARLTSSRIAISRCHRSTRSRSVRACDLGAAAGTRRCEPTASRDPGRCRHISSDGERQDRREQARRGRRRSGTSPSAPNAAGSTRPQRCKADPSRHRHRRPTRSTVVSWLIRWKIVGKS